ncbi:MAG: 16S rRNA (cytosine(1402)-N(4))-methyltransferase RsmH, partial [Treponema sp.]|nr:16S rRNA (cytosine(1402)-N(4))-methyltransferase RsmH [Treponema sp.]
MEAIHKPVLLDSCISMLSPSFEKKLNPLMCDSTLGEGGHSYAFLSAFKNLTVIGIDADSKIQERAKLRLSEFENRIHFHNVWAKDFYKDYPQVYSKPDAILFDLGISVYHYELSGRGFSFRHDEDLDMRLNPNLEKTASDIVNYESEENLSNIIYNYGEEKLSRKISSAIVNARKSSKITSSKQLADIIYECVPEYYRHAHIHPSTRTFQALRIEVNGELKNLLEM